jgi:hypothetical protein
LILARTARDAPELLHAIVHPADIQDRGGGIFNGSLRNRATRPRGGMGGLRASEPVQPKSLS